MTLHPPPYTMGQTVKFVGDPDVLKYPVPVGTKGTYQGVAKETYHWVHFVGTEKVQLVHLNEITAA